MKKRFIYIFLTALLTMALVVMPASAATLYLDYKNGNDSNDGTSWANAWKTITSGPIATRTAPGDTIRIAKSPDPVSLGNAQWTDNSVTVILESPANSLSLTSLISKNSLAQGGSEGWWAIKSIDGAKITLFKNYAGKTEYIATYKRDTISTIPATTRTENVQSIQYMTHDNMINYEGGYNTVTSEQDGETYFYGSNGYGRGLYMYGMQYIKTRYINFSRYDVGLYHFYNYFGYHDISCSDNNTAGIYLEKDTIGTTFLIRNINANGGYGLRTNKDDCGNTFDVTNVLSNGSYGLYFPQGNNNIISVNNARRTGTAVYLSDCDNNLITSLTARDNKVALGFNRTYKNVVRNMTTSGNTWCIAGNTSGGQIQVINPSFAEAEDRWVATSTLWARSNSRVHLQKINGDVTDNRIYTDGGLISTQRTIKSTSSGLVWQLSPTGTGYLERTADYPLDLKIATITVEANVPITVTARLKRDTTDITGMIVCRGNQIAGVDSDVSDIMTADADMWEQLSISFTPAEDGVVEIEVWAYGGDSHSLHIDDVRVRQ